MIIMKTTVLFCLVAIAHSVHAQPIDVAVRIATEMNVRAISPLIYGVNNSNNASANLASRRQGGDRYTTYNWENNASNSGHWTDDPASIHLNHTNDANVTGYVPSSVPAKAITDFHDVSIAAGAYSLVTLQAGHVARDLNGPVSVQQSVPNPERWREVRFLKGAALSLQPDIDDDYVYMDELVNYLVDKYGLSTSATGIRGYGISNEPGLWHRVHPRSHPTKEGYADIFAVTRDLATTIKTIDPGAEVYGGVTYGFSEMKDFDGAPDRAAFAQYRWYIDALLATLRAASDAANMRLVDALDVHWYSEAEGIRDYEPVAWSQTTSDIAVARVQAPRSLWDRSYVEKSWITGAPNRYSHTNALWAEPAIALIPRLQQSIDTYYPGTKLAFGEFGYGGYDHVTGGLAVADALGIFGRDGVYLVNHWDAISNYVESAYKLYRNVDGRRTMFGSMSVMATTSDVENSSTYAATNAGGDSLHIILINKHFTRPVRASIAIASSRQWGTGQVFGFDATSTDVRRLGSVALDANAASYEVAPLSAVHLMFASAASTADDVRLRHTLSAVASPNPCRDNTAIIVAANDALHVRADVFNALGELVRAGSGERFEGSARILLDTRALAPGSYRVRIEADGVETSIPLSVVR